MTETSFAPQSGSREDWLNLKQASLAYPALGERYFRQLVAERRIPVYKVGGPRSRILLRRSDIEALLIAGRKDAIGAA